MHSVDVCDATALASMRDEWNRVFRESRFPTPFASWEWITTWLGECSGGTRFEALRVRADGRTVALLPLVRQRSIALAPDFVAAGVDRVGADHLDLISAPADAEESLNAIAAYLRRRRGQWRTLRLPMVAEDSALFGFVRALPAGRTSIRPSTRAPYLSIEGDYASFLGSLKSDHRRKLRMRTRRLLDERGAEYVTYTALDHPRALARLFELHRSRHAVKRMRSAFDREEIARFHAALLRALPAECVVLRGLELDGQVIAMFYGFRYSNRLFYFQLGHDPLWSDWSPGLVMVTKTIEEACTTGCVEFNFLQGDEPFKRLWTRQGRMLYDCALYDDSWTGSVTRAGAHAARFVRRAAKPAFARLRGSTAGAQAFQGESNG